MTDVTASTTRKDDAGHPVKDGYVCHACTEKTREHLRTLGDLLPHSAGKRARVKAIDYRTVGAARTADMPLPYDPRVTRVVDPIVNGLLGTHNLVCEGKGWHLALSSPVGAVAVTRWLEAHVDWLRTVPEGLDEFAFIETAASDLQRLFDRPPEQLYLGTCGREVEGHDEPCTEHVYVERRTPLPPFAECRRCKGTVDVDSRREEFRAAVKDYQATMRELVSLAPMFLQDGVSKRTLDEWTRNRLLLPAGEREVRNIAGDWRRVPSYRIGDLDPARKKWEAMKAERKAQRRAG